MKQIIITISAAILLAGCGVNTSPGEGEKIGQIVRLTKVGIARSTWEAQLLRGGMSNGSGTVGVTPFLFTIENESDVLRVQEYMRNQTEVLVRYRTEGVYSAFRTKSGGDFMTSIEPAPHSK